MLTNPYSEQTFDAASERLRLTLALLAKRRIPPSPLNYRIGYDHVAGTIGPLREAFDTLMDRPEGLTPEDLWTLYRQFYVHDDETLIAFRAQLQSLVANLREEIQQPGGHLDHYAETLKLFSESLEATTSPYHIAAQVQNVLAETRIVDASQKELKAQLAQALAKTEALRHELSEVRQESLTDALTGVANRKAFDTTLANEMQLARDAHTPLCLLLADIDHFKLFNDTYGHLVGDQVLRFVASIMKRTVKGKDSVARYGGEEFAIVLPETDWPGAEVVAEQVRAAVSARNLANKSKHQDYGQVTISIGVARYGSGDSAEAFIQRADQALYLAKDRGRNRVEKAA